MLLREPSSASGRMTPQLDGDELLANLMLGTRKVVEPLPAACAGGLRAALQTVLIRALCRPPCLVSFSGGGDSSAVQALATDTARRHGLALPVPVTMRFDGVPAAEESGWQQLVLDHLGLRNHEVLELTDELDALGPAATRLLLAHGVRWPANAHMHRPIIELARGGTVLTGIGGDELFSTGRSVRQLMAGCLPRRVLEEIWLARRRPTGYRWLTPLGFARVCRALAREEASWPRRWDRAVRHWHTTRAFAAMNDTLALVAEDTGTQVLSPFMDPQVLVELARLGGVRGFPSRTVAMRRLCGGLLPEALIGRRTKATFGGALWGEATRRFMSAWDGGGVDPRYVDVRRVRAEFEKAEPDFRTILLVHRAWLDAQPPSSPSR